MGIFHEMTEVINRTATLKNVRFDGQDLPLKPNYTEDGKRIEDVQNLVPKQVVPYALNQNVIMGSEDAMNPSEFRSMIGIPAKKEGKKYSWNDCSFYDETENDETTRVSKQQIEEELIGDTRYKTQRGGRKHRATDAALGVSTMPFDLRTSV